MKKTISRVLAVLMIVSMVFVMAGCMKYNGKLYMSYGGKKVAVTVSSTTVTIDGYGTFKLKNTKNQNVAFAWGGANRISSADIDDDVFTRIYIEYDKEDDGGIWFDYGYIVANGGQYTLTKY